MRRAVIALVAVTLGIGAAACGDDEAGGGAVDVSMTEYAFDPAPISLAEGGELHVTNEGHEVHNLTIPDLGKGLELSPGGDGTLHLDGQPAGTYPVICDIPGHAEQGMKTEITIG
jgi:uncharacterized cupredoxin-like copper-binding protein